MGPEYGAFGSQCGHEYKFVDEIAALNQEALGNLASTT